MRRAALPLVWQQAGVAAARRRVWEGREERPGREVVRRPVKATEAEPKSREMEVRRASELRRRASAAEEAQRARPPWGVLREQALWQRDGE